MTDVAQLADRIAIAALLDDYAAAIDARDFDRVAAVFTPDAVLDYTSAGGPRGPVGEVIAWVQSSLPAVTLTQHLLTNRRVTIDRDTATARCQLLNPLLFAGADGVQLLLLGGAYDDQLVRTDAGWRITGRTHTTSWTAGPLPARLEGPRP